MLRRAEPDADLLVAEAWGTAACQGDRRVLGDDRSGGLAAPPRAPDRWLGHVRQGYWVPYAVDARALSDCCGMLIRICACPSCGGDRGAESSDELESLLDRREELIGELQRIESELEALRK